MQIRSAVWRSLRCVALATAGGWLAIFAWPDLLPAVSVISQRLFWSVPFVLATSLATFTNTLRVFDRIEELVRGERLDNLPSRDRAYLLKTIKSTETLTANLLVNSLIVILAGIAYFVVGAFLSVPFPRWLPSGIQAIQLEIVGVAVRFGLGVLATVILVVQFRTIPPLVAFYKFFTVDRHLSHGAPLGRGVGEGEPGRQKPLKRGPQDGNPDTAEGECVPERGSPDGEGSACGEGDLD